MNGDETGVDCGGACVQICSNTVIAPQVVWVKSFEVVAGQYNAVAYIENSNQTSATPQLEYTFQLLSDGKVVTERSGSTILPPNSMYPIFEGKIMTDGKAEVTDTVITLKPASLWLPASIGRDQFRSRDIKLTGADERPRLDVEIENAGLTEARDLEVVATVFNELGEPVTASQTYLEHIGSRSTEHIVFTWPQPIAKTVKSCIIPTDVLVAIDLSGSMNNDGGTPPQPVTAALQAAGRFIKSLNANDRVGVVTFATNATVTTELTNQHEAVAEKVLVLGIDPAEETGFTNTAAALLAAQSELSSSRHNLDARRVVVLLTDGLPTAAGDEDALAAAVTVAEKLDQDGVEVYAIGLGSGVDQAFVRSIASDDTNAYFTPSIGDLASIYAEITLSLCTAGPTKIDVIAKTKTNFAPLQ
jgi:Mg-chelatase subunit ChlD